MRRKLIKRRLFMIGYTVNEIGEYIEHMSFDGEYVLPKDVLPASIRKDVEKLENEQNELYEEHRFLETLKDIGYYYYEDESDYIDINDRFPREPKNPRKFVEIPIEKNINQLYIDYRNIDILMHYVSIKGIADVFKNSSLEEQYFFIDKLREYILSIDSKIKRIQETLTIYETKKKYVKKVGIWSEKLEKIVKKLENDKLVAATFIKRLEKYLKEKTKVSTGKGGK